MNEAIIRDLLDSFRKDLVTADEVVARINEALTGSETALASEVLEDVMKNGVSIQRVEYKDVFQTTPPNALSQRETSKYVDSHAKRAAHHDAFQAMRQACTCAMNPDYCNVHAA